MSVFEKMCSYLKLNPQTFITERYEKPAGNTFVDFRGKLSTGIRSEVCQQPYFQKQIQII